MGGRVNDVRWILGEEEVAEALDAYRARPIEPGRFLLDRRAGKPDAEGNYTAAPIIDVGLDPCPTITGAAFGRGVWTVVDTRRGDTPGDDS